MVCLYLHWIRGTIFLVSFLSIFSGIFGNLHRIKLKIVYFYGVF